LSLDRAKMARFILTVMEGGLMQARAADDLGVFDEAVAVLREHLELLQQRVRKQRAARRSTHRGSSVRKRIR
jgi:hypothetical protein